MEFIKNVKWEEVFEDWQNRESNNPDWVHCATVVKGWPDWQSWRQFTAEQFEAPNRSWQLFQFKDPLSEIPKMLVGPFNGWQSRVTEKNQLSFEQLLSIPEQKEIFSNTPTIQKIQAGLPFNTNFIGIIREDIGKMVCIDGHHRATAITLQKLQNNQIDFRKSLINIFLTKLHPNECDTLDQMLQRGTAKDQSI